MTKVNKNNSKLVKNVRGTSHPRHKINRLSRKFVREGGTASARCQVKLCKNSAAATAHVKVTDGRRKEAKKWHLCSVCAAHNHPTKMQPMALRKNAKLVPVAAVRKRRAKKAGASKRIKTK